MRARTKTLVESKHFELVRHTKTKSDKTYYTIRNTSSYLSNGKKLVSAEEIRKHFDPAGNRGSKTGISWKFKNRKEAEQLIMTAIIKWSE